MAAQAESNEAEGTWVSAAPNEKWVIVEVTKPGRGGDSRRLRAESNATFQIQLDGTGAGQTKVFIDGEEGELSAIPEGKAVRIHWRPVEDSHYAMFATRIAYRRDQALADPAKSAEETTEP